MFNALNNGMMHFSVPMYQTLSFKIFCAINT